MQPDRQNAIMDIARRQGKVTVEALSQQFQVTQQTIRKDLHDLCQKRLLARVHGGAVIAPGVEKLGYEARRVLMAEEKDAIGRVTADIIPDNASLFMNIGTTIEAVSRALLQHEGLHVITSSINVAHLMWAYPGIEVTVAGGTVRSADGLISGDKTVEFISQFKAEFAVIGCSSFDADGSVLSFEYQHARGVGAMVANSRYVILVADASKFERPAPIHRGTTFDQVDLLVTDRCVDERVRRLCADAGTKLIEAVADA